VNLLALVLMAQGVPNEDPDPGLIDTAAPYLQCLITPPVADCSLVRAKTAKELDRLLAKQGGMSKDERLDQVKSVLAALDQSVAQIRAAGPPAGSVATDALSTSRSFPWALHEQVGRYSACVSGNFDRRIQGTPVIRQGAQVRALFADAKSQCSDVRTAATAEADAILRDKEPSAEKRAKIVADALDTVDGQGESFAATVDRVTAAAERQK
jgi:hypothetical protein